MKRWRRTREAAPQRRALVIADASLTQEALLAAHEICLSLADTLREPVTFAVANASWLSETVEDGNRLGEVHALDRVEPTVPGVAQTMSSAPFVYRDDGRPDWGRMWSGYCELALLGGPPHRGEDDRLEAAAANAHDPASDAVAEIRRGIWETTGLIATADEPGWIGVRCDSRKMAAWLCAAIILENVEARFEGTRLLVPASASFTLKDQVKSVITVVAKTNHYWQDHMKAQAVVCDTVALVMRQRQSAAEYGAVPGTA